MVRRAALLLLIATGVFLLACNSGNSETASQQPEPTAAPTRVIDRPTAGVEPRSGPPGSEITVSGSNWPAGIAIDVTGALPPGVHADPFATTTTNESGQFTVSFRLEAAPDGSDLEVGRYNLIVRSAANEVIVGFQVETRRPLQNPGPG